MKNKGISLIVLIITIVVIIILAASIILNLTNTNIISNASEAVLKQDIATLKSELDLYVSDKFVEEKGKYDVTKLYADTNIATYDGENIEDTNKDGVSNIYDILTSLDSTDWKDNVYLRTGSMVFKKSGLSAEQVETILEMGVEVDGMPSITSMVLESTETTVTVSLSVNMQEEVEKYLYILNDGEAEESTELTKTYTELTPGVNYKVEVIMVLKDGTQIPQSQMIYTKTPIGNIEYIKSESDWVKDSVTVELKYSEETLPQGYEIQYKLTGGMTKDWSTYTEVVTVTENNTTVMGRLYNSTLDEELAGSSAIVSNIDKEAPSIPTTLNASVTSTTISSGASGSIDTLSGNIKYMYSRDNVTWNETGNFSGLNNNTIYTIYVKAVDKVGNESEVMTSKVTTEYAGWELNPPVATISMNTSGKITEGTTITIGGTSNIGIKNVTLTLGGKTIYTEELDNVKTYSKTLTLSDLTGLEDVLFYSRNALTISLKSKADRIGYRSIDVQNYTVGSAASLAKLAEIVNGGNTLQGETIFQIADIDLSTVCSSSLGNWPRIGYASTTDRWFDGTYNGNNKSVTNLYINNTSEDKSVGLFGFVGYYGTVKNLTVSGNVTNNFARAVGGIVAISEGLIQNCINNVNVTCNIDSFAGGVCCFLYGTIKDCTNNGTIKSSLQGAGGICGYEYYHGREGSFTNNAVYNAEVVIENCTNNGYIQTTLPDERLTNANLPWVGVGGIVGAAEKGKITQCKNSNLAVVNGNLAVGGICGLHLGGNTTDEISNCTNEGPVSAAFNMAGGIIGKSQTNISYCKNTGDVTAQGTTTNDYTLVGAGGIAARLGNGKEIIYCSNVDANINNGNAFTGGIVGWVDGDNDWVQGCYNRNSNVICNNWAVGGIVGRINDHAYINNCYNYLSSNAYTISGSGNVGGVVGVINIDNSSNYFVTVRNSYNVAQKIVSQDGSTHGELVGAVHYPSKIENCYYLNSSSLGALGNVAVQPTLNTSYQKTDGLFKGDVTSSTSVAYLLENNTVGGIWSRSSTINGGYPHLVLNP